MTKLKIAIVAAAATVAFAAPSFAQNFQGFGLPSVIADGQTAPQTQKPVAMKTQKHVKHINETR